MIGKSRGCVWGKLAQPEWIRVDIPEEVRPKLRRKEELELQASR